MGLTLLLPSRIKALNIFRRNDRIFLILTACWRGHQNGQIINTVNIYWVLLYARSCAKLFKRLTTYIQPSQQSHLWLRRLKQREARWPAQGHRVGKWQNRILNPGLWVQSLCTITMVQSQSASGKMWTPVIHNAMTCPSAVFHSILQTFVLYQNSIL